MTNCFSHDHESGKVSITDLPQSDVQVLGTPAEFERFIHFDVSELL